MKKLITLLTVLLSMNAVSANADDISASLIQGIAAGTHFEIMQVLIIAKSPTTFYDAANKYWTFVSPDGGIVEKCFSANYTCTVSDSQGNPATKTKKLNSLSVEVTGHAASATIEMLKALVAAKSPAAEHNTQYNTYNYGIGSSSGDDNFAILHAAGCSLSPANCQLHADGE